MFLLLRGHYYVLLKLWSVQIRSNLATPKGIVVVNWWGEKKSNFLAPEFVFILAHPVYKMWIIQEPNILELWNKLHFEEEKKRRVYIMFNL